MFDRRGRANALVKRRDSGIFGEGALVGAEVLFQSNLQVCLLVFFIAEVAETSA